MNRRFIAMSLLGLLVLGATWSLAQGFRRSREIRPELVDRNGVPQWSNDEHFKGDIFTFVRIRYSSGGGPRGYGRGYSGGGSWITDFPDSDLNFSFRLHQMTALDVDPNGKIIELTDDELFDYPFIYIVEPGRSMWLTDAECAALRRYLLNGGFLMVDDFWGEAEYRNFYDNIKRVFPNREPVELPLEHEIFHCVFDLKEKPQIPGLDSLGIDAIVAGQTTERWDAPHSDYRAIFDDEGRMMVIVCHNTDTGDGWEREGADPRYFKMFSEKFAFPLGINIVTYAMTH
jgi:hypothetical protein